MHILFLLSFFLLFTACSTTPEINTSETKIQSNQSSAAEARVEYKQLQAQRKKE